MTIFYCSTDCLNARCSLDFVHDQFANGRRFRILNIVDDVTKKCLGAIPETSISGAARDPRTDGNHRATRQARNDRVRPWHRVHLQRYARLVQGRSHRLALHRAGKADAERLRREVSTAGCAMSCSTRPCSSISTTPAPRSLSGSPTTISSAPLVAEIPAAYAATSPQTRPAPPIVRCSTCATWRIKPRDSNCRWMRIQWQVRMAAGDAVLLDEDCADPSAAEPCVVALICAGLYEGSFGARKTPAISGLTSCIGSGRRKT